MALIRWLYATFTRFAPGVAASFPWLGGALMLVAAAFAVHSLSFARAQQRSLATVTENVATFAPEGGVFYAPRLRFRTQTGDLIRSRYPPATAAHLPSSPVKPYPFCTRPDTPNRL